MQDAGCKMQDSGCRMQWQSLINVDLPPTCYLHPETCYL